MNKDTFICAMCNQEFKKGRADEEAYAETEELFGTRPVYPDDDNFATVCDDCFQKLPIAHNP